MHTKVHTKGSGRKENVISTEYRRGIHLPAPDALPLLRHRGIAPGASPQFVPWSEQFLVYPLHGLRMGPATGKRISSMLCAVFSKGILLRSPYRHRPLCCRDKLTRQDKNFVVVMMGMMDMRGMMAHGYISCCACVTPLFPP